MLITHPKRLSTNDEYWKADNEISLKVNNVGSSHLTLRYLHQSWFLTGHCHIYCITDNRFPVTFQPTNFGFFYWKFSWFLGPADPFNSVKIIHRNFVVRIFACGFQAFQYFRAALLPTESLYDSLSSVSGALLWTFPTVLQNKWQTVILICVILLHIDVCAMELH